MMAALLPMPSARADIDHRSFTLPNGLHVVLHEDHTTPIVAIDVVVHAGWRDEVQGKRHLAHLVEHLMFQRSESAERDFAVEIERLGGTAGASTHVEHTHYDTVIPSTHLERVLWLEADRLGWLPGGLEADDLEAQREVIRSEGRQRVRDSIFAPALYVLPNTMYKETHPYWLPADGAFEDLDGLTLEDVRGFWEERYAPSNASLSIAGDFDPALVEQLVRDTFGTIPDRPTDLRREPKQGAAWLSKKVTVRADVPQGVVMVRWPTPAWGKPGDAELDMFAALISGTWPDGRTWSAHQRSLRGSGEFTITVSHDRRNAPSRVLEGIWDVVEAFASVDVGRERLQGVRSSMRRTTLAALDGPAAVAARLNMYWRLSGSTEALDADLGRYRDVSPGSMRRAIAGNLYNWEPVVVFVRYSKKAPPPCFPGLELKGTECAEVGK